MLRVIDNLVTELEVGMVNKLNLEVGDEVDFTEVQVKVLSGVLVLGLIETLLAKYLVVIMYELNYQLEVKLILEMKTVSAKVSNSKLV